MPQSFDIYGVGNAIVDTEIRVDDAFISSNALRKGMMTLATVEQQETLKHVLGDKRRVNNAGGSAANTMVGIARFGGRAFYSGKVGSDRLGSLYRQSITRVGVNFEGESAEGLTGSCLVLVTPDGERTMQTNLGCSSMLEPKDISTPHIINSKMLYIEGYLWSSPGTQAAAMFAIKTAHSSGVPMAITFSDPIMVENFRNTFREVARDWASVIFCNEVEAMMYSGTTQRSKALESLGKDCPLVFMTCGSDGSLISDNGHITQIAGYQVPAIDTTGAGDAYAAGVLYGLTHQLTHIQAGTLGSFASALVVSKLGPRLQHSLAAYIPAILSGSLPTDLPVL